MRDMLFALDGGMQFESGVCEKRCGRGDTRTVRIEETYQPKYQGIHAATAMQLSSSSLPHSIPHLLLLDGKYTHTYVPYQEWYIPYSGGGSLHLPSFWLRWMWLQTLPRMNQSRWKQQTQVKRTDVMRVQRRQCNYDVCMVLKEEVQQVSKQVSE